MYYLCSENKGADPRGDFRFFSIYVGWTVFYGVKILSFVYFLGFHEKNVYFFKYSDFLVFLGVLKILVFFGCLTLKKGLF